MQPKRPLGDPITFGRSRIAYIGSTAFSTFGVIAAIQWFGLGYIAWDYLTLYTLLGAIFAHFDWQRQQKRHTLHGNPPTDAAPHTKIDPKL